MDPQPPPLAPPTHPGPLGAGLPPAWPKVLGIICSILGGLTVLGGLWGILAPFLMGPFMGMMVQKQTQDVMVRWRPWNVSYGALSLALGLLLLAGGIRLAARRRSGARMLLIWAPLKMLLVVASIVFAYFMGRDQLAAAQAQSTPVPTAMMVPFLAVGLILGLAWGWTFPVFLMVWLTRPKPRAHMAEWA